MTIQCSSPITEKIIVDEIKEYRIYEINDGFSLQGVVFDKELNTPIQRA